MVPEFLHRYLRQHSYTAVSRAEGAEEVSLQFTCFTGKKKKYTY